MTSNPSIDEAAARLHAKGWSTSDVAIDRPSGRLDCELLPQWN